MPSARMGFLSILKISVLKARFSCHYIFKDGKPISFHKENRKKKQTDIFNVMEKIIFLSLLMNT